MVNVKDYGVVGNGLVDDYAAIQAAAPKDAPQEAPQDE
jgi:polygalacturonase